MTNQLPAHLQQFQAPDIGSAALANLGAAMPPHVSIGNNRFTLIDAANNEIPVPTFDPKTGVYLDAAIIDVADVMSRIYFSGAFDSTADGVRPDCYSDNGIGPSTGSSTPQAPTCAACPRSEWTKVNANGNKVPWCTQKYKIAILIPGFDTLFLLAVPPASHGPLREYLATCKGNGINPANLVTRMWFTSQGILGFAPRPGGPQMAYIDVATAELRQRAYAEKKTDSLVGRNDVARPAGAIAAPVQQAGVQIPQTQSTPQGQQWPAQTQLMYPPHPNPSTPQQGAPVQQVQQPVPFGATPAQAAGHPGQFQQTPVQTAETRSPSEQPAPQRRKRRTQAEIAAANGAAQQPAGGQQQAPFPHPGQQVQPSGPFTSGAQTATSAAPTGTGAGFATQPATSAASQQQAPFPHPGQQVQQSVPFAATGQEAPFVPPSHAAGAPQGTAFAGAPLSEQLEFGIGQGQPASASPDVQSALNSFFGDQG